MAFEYRIGWVASSTASFHGETDWCEWPGDPDDTAEEIENALNEPQDASGPAAVPWGLEEAMDASGFEWWIETRENPHNKEAASAAPEKEQTR